MTKTEQAFGLSQTTKGKGGCLEATGFVCFTSHTTHSKLRAHKMSKSYGTWKRFVHRKCEETFDISDSHSRFLVSTQPLKKNFLSTQRRKKFLSQGGFSPLLPAVTEAGFIGSLRCFRPGAVAFRLSYRPWYHGPLLGPGPKREREGKTGLSDTAEFSIAQGKRGCTAQSITHHSCANHGPMGQG